MYNGVISIHTWIVFTTQWLRRWTLFYHLKLCKLLNHSAHFSGWSEWTASSTSALTSLILKSLILPARSYTIGFPHPVPHHSPDWYQPCGSKNNSSFISNSLAQPHIVISQFSRSVMSDSLGPIDCSMPDLPVHHRLPEFTQTHVHWVSDANQPSHPLSSLHTLSYKCRI